MKYRYRVKPGYLGEVHEWMRRNLPKGDFAVWTTYGKRDLVECEEDEHNKLLLRSCGHLLKPVRDGAT
jgi:hypothetical protein